MICSRLSGKLVNVQGGGSTKHLCSTGETHCMSTKMAGGHQSPSPKITYLRRKSVARLKQQKRGDQEPYQCGSECVNVPPLHDDIHQPSSGGPSTKRSPQTRHHPYNNSRSQTPQSPSSKSSRNRSPPRHLHPYDRVARYYPYHASPRPESLNAHTLLCSVKLSENLMADRPPPTVDEYPVAPVSLFQKNFFHSLKSM